MTIRNILAVLATAGLALPAPLLAQEQAVDAPRFQGSQAGVPFIVESRVPEAVRDELKAVYGVMVRPTTPYLWHFGSVQAIQRMPDGSLLGVADPRRAGLAAGY